MNENGRKIKYQCLTEVELRRNLKCNCQRNSIYIYLSLVLIISQLQAIAAIVMIKLGDVVSRYDGTDDFCRMGRQI